MWAVLAFAKLGQGKKAVDLFALLNPINHARTFADAERYKVEPYVIAADVYSVAPHIGRGGWTWYTGSAAWMYRAGVEGILGMRREGNFLIIAPSIPEAWPGFEATVHVAAARYEIHVENSSGLGYDDMRATLDGRRIECSQGNVRVLLEEGTHRLLITL
jgi:cyclic beta-1,2-glucan synthetase